MCKPPFLENASKIAEDATLITKQVVLMRVIATGPNMYSATWQFYFKGTLKEFHIYHITLILFLCFLKRQVKNKKANKAIDLLLNILSIVYIFPSGILLLGKGFNALNIPISIDKLIFYSRHAFFIALESKGKEFSTSSFLRYIQKYFIPAASFQWVIKTGPAVLVFFSKKVKYPIFYIGTSILVLLVVKQLLLSEKREKKNFSTINQEYSSFFEGVAFCLTEILKPCFLVALDLALVCATTSGKNAIKSSFTIEIPFNFSEFLGYPIEAFYEKKELEKLWFPLASKKTIELRVKREKDPYAFKSLKHDTIFIKPYRKKPLPTGFQKVIDPFALTLSNQPIWKQGAIKLLTNYLDISHVGSFFPIEVIETNEIEILYRDLLGKFYLVKNLFDSETQALIMQTEPLIDNKPFLANPHIKVKNEIDFYQLLQNVVKTSWGCCEYTDLEIEQRFSYTDCKYAFALKGNLKSFKDSLEYKISEESDSPKVELEEISLSPETSKILVSEKTLENLVQETQKTHSENSETLAMEKVKIDNAEENYEQKDSIELIEEEFFNAVETLADLDETPKPDVFFDAEENLVNLEQNLEPVQEMLVRQNIPEGNYQLNVNRRQVNYNNPVLAAFMICAASTFFPHAKAQSLPGSSASSPNFIDPNSMPQTVTNPVAPTGGGDRTTVIISSASLAITGTFLIIGVGRLIYNNYRLRLSRTQGDSETGRQTLLPGPLGTQPVRSQDRALAASRVDEAPSSSRSEPPQARTGMDLQQSQISADTSQNMDPSDVLRPGLPLLGLTPEGATVSAAGSELHRQDQSQQGREHGERFDEQGTTASAEQRGPAVSAVENLTSEPSPGQEMGAASAPVADLSAQTDEATAPANQGASTASDNLTVFNIAHGDRSVGAIDHAFAASSAGNAVVNSFLTEGEPFNTENELSGEGEISDRESEYTRSLLSEPIGHPEIDEIARRQRHADSDAEPDQAVSLPDPAAVSLTESQQDTMSKLIVNNINAQNLGLLDQMAQNNYTTVIFDRLSSEEGDFNIKVIYFHPEDEKDNSETGTCNTIFYIAGTGNYGKKLVTNWIKNFMTENKLDEKNRIKTEQHHICGWVYFLGKKRDCATGIPYLMNQMLKDLLLSEVASVPVNIGNDKTALIQHQLNAYRGVLTRGDTDSILKKSLGEGLTLDQMMEIIDYGVEKHYEYLKIFSRAYNTRQNVISVFFV